MKLVNMAIGGEPVSTLYEGERRFDIVARLDRQSRKSPDAIGRLPVYTGDGVPIPLAQVATIEVRDGQTLIARGDGRRCMTVRCDIVGRDQGGFVREAQESFDREITTSLRVSRRVAGNVREPSACLQALHGPDSHDHHDHFPRPCCGLSGRFGRHSSCCCRFPSPSPAERWPCTSAT